MLDQLAQSITAAATQKIITLERQYLTFCKEHAEPDEYVLHLAALASALNTSAQYEDAFGVAERCLRMDPAGLSCLFEKANALYRLGRLREAKSVIESSLRLGAITEIDASEKRNLRNLLLQVNAALNFR